MKYSVILKGIRDEKIYMLVDMDKFGVVINNDKFDDAAKNILNTVCKYLSSQKRVQDVVHGDDMVYEMYLRLKDAKVEKVERWKEGGYSLKSDNYEGILCNVEYGITGSKVRVLDVAGRLYGRIDNLKDISYYKYTSDKYNLFFIISRDDYKKAIADIYKVVMVYKDIKGIQHALIRDTRSNIYFFGIADDIINKKGTAENQMGTKDSLLMDLGTKINHLKGKIEMQKQLSDTVILDNDGNIVDTKLNKAYILDCECVLGLYVNMYKALLMVQDEITSC